MGSDGHSSAADALAFFWHGRAYRGLPPREVLVQVLQYLWKL
jgi:hypothetical protein